VVTDTISRSKVVMRLKQGEGVIEIRSPLFEYLRNPSSAPMRHYYASAYTRCLTLCQVDGLVEADESAAGCRLHFMVRGLGGAPRVDAGAA
jgi:hypothetical protein